MKLRTAFVLSLLAVLAVMAIPALYGVQHVREVRRIALDMRERTAEAAFKVGRIQTELERFERYQRAYVATGDPELAQRLADTRRLLESDLQELRTTGYAEAVEAADLPLPSLSALSSLIGLLMQSGLRDEATAVVQLELGPLLSDAAVSAEVLAATVDALTADRLANLDRITGSAVTTTTTALLVGLLVAGLLTVMAARVLTRPLNLLSSSMTRVADGQFEPPEHLPYERADEVGDLFRAFRSMALRLSDLDRMKAEFVGVASHDLKTPVNVITGYAELLSEEVGPELDDQHQEVLGALRRQSRTLSTRLNQLLEISRIQAAGLRLGLEEINVRHLVTELERSYGGQAARDGIAVETVADESTPTFLIADPDVLRHHVFESLLTNALKYTPRGSRVTLSTSGHGGTVTFEVADEGPAIPPESVPNLFDRYYRGRDPSGRSGAGLDLPIAKAAVEAHGGTISVASPPTGGAVFRVTLPIHPAHPSFYQEEHTG